MADQDQVMITCTVDMDRRVFLFFLKDYYICMYAVLKVKSRGINMFLPTFRFNEIQNKAQFSSHVSKKCKCICLGL